MGLSELAGARQKLIQLLRASVACSFCDGWGVLWCRRGGMPLTVVPRWGYSGFPTVLLGMSCLDDSEQTCPICKGTGES